MPRCVSIGSTPPSAALTLALSVLTWASTVLSVLCAGRSPDTLHQILTREDTIRMLDESTQQVEFVARQIKRLVMAEDPAIDLVQSERPGARCNHLRTAGRAAQDDAHARRASSRGLKGLVT